MSSSDPDSVDPMELFQMPSTEAHQTRTSAYWDTGYKWVAATRNKVADKAEILVRKAGPYTLEIKPALLLKNGKTKVVYPGVLEEMVVRAVTYMAMQRRVPTHIGRAKNNEEFLTLTFSLWALRKTLIEFGHTYSLTQIAEAVEICGDAGLTYRCENETHRGVIGGAIFQSVRAINAKNDTDGRGALRHVMLHPMLSRGILERDTRTIDFNRVMRLQMSLARWLYDRLSHNFTQAIRGAFLHKKGYHISLQTIVVETGMSGEIKNQLTEIRNAIVELEEAGVLQKGMLKGGTIEKVSHADVEGPGRKPITDVVWTLYPSDAVATDIITENKQRLL